MPLIPVVGRKSWKIRLLIGALYLVLALGALTMVYPFLLMICASVESDYEKTSFEIVPPYLHSERALFGKYVEDKYRGDISQINAAYGTTFATLQDVAPPPGRPDPAAVARWDRFTADLPARYKLAGFGGAAAAFSPSPLLDRYHDFLQRRFQGNIHAMDRAYTEEDENFLTVFPPFEQPAKRNWTPDRSPKSRDWAAFQATLPTRYFLIVGADPIYRTWLKEEAYPSLDALNKAWGPPLARDWSQITLPARPQGGPARRRDWKTFVRTKLPFRFCRVDAAARPAYQRFLQERYKGRLADYNAHYGAHRAAFSAIPLPDPETLPASGPPLLDWLDFLQQAPPETLRADTAETRYADFACRGGASPCVYPTAWASDFAYMHAHPGPLRRDFLSRNYRLVIQYILGHGQAVWNTFLYCSLAILTALVVNPLCAYALSRYNLPYGSAVLLFLLTTMAFPAEVAMIPNFLLLKQLGMLNTFYALILPGAASGFSIFLLKGFFDSLPKELYEAGTLDGATEMRMFWNITLPLSRPIFAVIGLQAFSGAYGAFLFALLVCQNHRMWTMMVWLYELQSNNAPTYVMMAALTLAAVPTLVVFIFAQNTIMKGIILPSFK